MADFDLEALSLGELKKMQKDVAKAISTYEDRQKAEARAKVEALARDFGYSLAELVGTETKSSRAPVAARAGLAAIFGRGAGRYHDRQGTRCGACV